MKFIDFVFCPITGKRVLSDGRLQYLIEWDGVS